jgi:hypothetical protein
MLLQVEVMVPPLPPQVGAVMMFQEIFIPLIVFAFGGLVLFGTYKTVNKYLERRHGGPELEGLRTDIEQLRSKAEGVEELVYRLGEVEERLDFAERILAQQKQDRLGPGV